MFLSYKIFKTLYTGTCIDTVYLTLHVYFHQRSFLISFTNICVRCSPIDKYVYCSVVMFKYKFLQDNIGKTSLHTLPIYSTCIRIFFYFVYQCQ